MSGNPPVWEQAEAELARGYVPQAGTNNALLLSALLNNAEQALSFAAAHIDQQKSTIAQLRSVIGA